MNKKSKFPVYYVYTSDFLNDVEVWKITKNSAFWTRIDNNARNWHDSGFIKKWHKNKDKHSRYDLLYGRVREITEAELILIL